MTEVYRLLSPNYDERCSKPNQCFSTDKCYSTALYTKREGTWPNEKYTTTNPLQYVGKYVRTERMGYGNGGSVWEIFNNNGKEEKVELDYYGKTCFVETPCKSTGGKRKSKKTRKQRKGRKGTRKH